MIDRLVDRFTKWNLHTRLDPFIARGLIATAPTPYQHFRGSLDMRREIGFETGFDSSTRAIIGHLLTKNENNCYNLQLLQTMPDGLRSLKESIHRVENPSDRVDRYARRYINKRHINGVDSHLAGLKGRIFCAEKFIYMEPIGSTPPQFSSLVSFMKYCTEFPRTFEDDSAIDLYRAVATTFL